jgi:hypothetical protein
MCVEEEKPDRKLEKDAFSVSDRELWKPSAEWNQFSLDKIQNFHKPMLFH